MGWVIVGTGTDFTANIDQIVLDYLFSKWSISDPAKGTAQKDEASSLRFKVGFDDQYKPYEINTLKMRTESKELQVGATRQEMFTYVDVGIRMTRLSRDAVDPQLRNMELEVQRIIAEYVVSPQDIPGIKNLLFLGDENIYSGDDTYSQSTWRSVVHMALWYEKQEI